MKVIVTEDTQVLIPNQEHKNFTDSTETVKTGTILEGNETLIKGKRRGDDFVYKLFSFKDNQNNYKLIYIKKTKPMETTEVTLGADAAVSDTIVKIPSAKAFFTTKAIIFGLVGAGAGFGLAKYKFKVEGKAKMALFILGGAALGLTAAKLYEKRKAISVKAAK